MIMKRMQRITACKSSISEYLSLPKEERAFIWASCVVNNEDEKAALDKAKRGR